MSKSYSRKIPKIQKAITPQDELIVQNIQSHVRAGEWTATEDLYCMLVGLIDTARKMNDKPSVEWVLTKLKELSAWVDGHIETITSDELFADVYATHKKTMLALAPSDFDSYLRYVEWERPLASSFYMPRRKQLLGVVHDMQKLADKTLDLLAISMPPGVGKTTLAIMFITWLGGREPDKPILGGSHSNSFLRGVYDECLRIITGNGGEYLWSDVFPEARLVSTDAKDMRIDLGRRQRFETLEFSSIGSGNAGKVRAGSLLYCDDLVDGLETAMSRDRLEKLWQQYTTDLRQRKMGGCRELHIATRWSVHDVIGRLENMYENDPRAKFVVCPAVNEDGESNFDYKFGVGFDTAFYAKQKEVMDEVSWKALYMNEPIEREGLLYDADELRRYFELPDSEPDAIIAVCDTKDRGSDYCVMPVVYKYGQDLFVEDCVCDNSAPEVINPKLTNKLLKHKVQIARFESNAGGGAVATAIQQSVKDKNGNTKITTKFTTANKETKILVASPYVKEHCLFRDDSVITANKDYRTMLRLLCSYSLMGKNKHDDVPDAFAQLVDFAENMGSAVVKVFQRPF